MIETGNWEKKCWGRVRHIEHQNALISILEVEKGWRCSKHYHTHRFNSFRVITGSLLIELFNSQDLSSNVHQLVVDKGKEVTVCPGILHRFQVLESGIVVETYWTTDGTVPSIFDIFRFDEGGKAE